MGRELVCGRSDSVGSRGALGTSRSLAPPAGGEKGGVNVTDAMGGPGNFFLV